MKNLVIIGNGNTLKIRSMVMFIEKEINNFYKNQNVNIYNEDKLDMARFKPELLEKRGRFSLNTNKDIFIKTYVGVFNCDYNKYYDQLFQQLEMPQFAGTPDLSKTELLRLVYNAFYKNDKKDSLNRSGADNCIDTNRLYKNDDFSLAYSFDYLNLIKSEACFMIIWRNNEKKQPDIFGNMEKKYIQLIEQLDHDYGEVFASAYITNVDTDQPTEYTYLYNYTYRQNPSKYRDYLLGIEWAVYFGKKIANKVNFNLFPENEVVERLENGVLMMAKCDLLEYDDSYRRELMPVLNEYLLPCCGYYELNQLRNMKPVFCTPKTVAIIKDVYLPQQICPPVVWISSKDDFAFDDLQILNDNDETYVFYGGFEKLIKMFED